MDNVTNVKEKLAGLTDQAYKLAFILTLSEEGAEQTVVAQDDEQRHYLYRSRLFAVADHRVHQTFPRQEDLSEYPYPNRQCPQIQ